MFLHFPTLRECARILFKGVSQPMRLKERQMSVVGHFQCTVGSAASNNAQIGPQQRR
jgi:hypothetical protein